ncbi:unnamed protein product [Arabidopsis halleri]
MDRGKKMISSPVHDGSVHHQTESRQPWELPTSVEVYLHYIQNFRLFSGR